MHLYYPLQTIEDILAKIQGADTFVVLGSNQAYEQVQLEKEQVQL